MFRTTLRYSAVLLALAVLFTSCGRKKYDNKISKDTQQPDKVLFDAAIDDIEHSRYERARLTLQTLMNTYDTSEFMAKSKLAVADSWLREGGAHGMAQAEAEYKDFILFYPHMEEAAEAQAKICQMQFKQLEKADRDPAHSIRAEEECKQLLQQFPNSKHAPEAQQIMLKVQEVRAEGEYRVGTFYLKKGSLSPAANRLQGLTNQFPIFSKADDALWELAGAYSKMGDRFENAEAEQYTRIVKEYPLSEHVEPAKAKLLAMNRQVPESDPVQYARMKYELENRENRGLMSKMWGPFSSRPDMTAAAKSGTPQMDGFKPTIPVSVPTAAAGAQGVSVEVSADIVSNPTAIDTNPDARSTAGQANAAAAGAAAQTPAAPLPATVTRTGVDINTASEAALQKLPGVGKSDAQRIVAARPYQSLDELKKAGFSQKDIDKMKPPVPQAKPTKK